MKEQFSEGDKVHITLKGIVVELDEGYYTKEYSEDCQWYNVYVPEIDDVVTVSTSNDGGNIKLEKRD